MFGESYDVIINFPCVLGPVFLRIIHSKQSVLSNYYNTLNLKGFGFFTHTVTVVILYACITCGRAGAPKTAIKIALHVFVKITHGFITTN